MHHYIRLLVVACLIAQAGTVCAQTGNDNATPLNRFKWPGATSPLSESSVSPDERAALLRQGEAALAGGNIEVAENAFERAGYIVHAADAEMGLIRTYMQSGQYRRALNFAAHTAGVHPTDPGGPALYAWLLHIGGQGAVAQRLLNQADARLPGTSLLADVRKQLQDTLPFVTPALLSSAPRFSPYGAPSGSAGKASAVGSAVLVDNGRRALVPIATIGRGKELWVRNGLGHLRKATLEKRIAGEGLALLKLEQPLAATVPLQQAARDPFPGSIGYSMEYAVSRQAHPAWPVLSAGFLGAVIGPGTERELGITLPKGPRGGPVFDAAGRLTGFAMPGKDGMDKFVALSRLGKDLGGMLGQAAAAGVDSRVSMDAVYEAGMVLTLQVLAR